MSGKKRRGKNARSAFYLPGFGYISRREVGIGARIAAKYGLSLEFGLDCSDEARREIIEAIRADRALRGL